MNRCVFVLGSASAVVAVPTVGGAQAGLTAQGAIARLFTAPVIQPEWFSPVFRSAVSLDQVRAIVADVVGALGAYRAIAPNGDGFALTFADGTMQAEATVDAQGVLTALLFSRMQNRLASDRLTSMFGPDRVPAAWFSDRFLSSVPIDKVQAIVTALKAQDGTLATVTPSKDGTYEIAFENGRVRARIFLGSDGKISGLLLQPESS
jgi:hypothetical protein